MLLSWASALSCSASLRMLSHRSTDFPIIRLRFVLFNHQGGRPILNITKSAKDSWGTQQCFFSCRAQLIGSYYSAVPWQVLCAMAKMSSHRKQCPKSLNLNIPRNFMKFVRWNTYRTQSSLRKLIQDQVLARAGQSYGHRHISFNENMWRC